MKIALIAHDKKKSAIIELAKQYKEVLAGYELYATGTTGTLIMGETSLPINRMKSGPLGGDQQIGAMLAFTAVSTIGIAPLQGDLNALISCCSEHTTLKTGHRLDGMMYSCSSLGLKLGGAIGTAICGWLLDATGYVENAVTQNAATIGMLNFLYLWLPVILCAAVGFLLVFLRVEKANEKLLADREDKTVPDVYGNV